MPISAHRRSQSVVVAAAALTLAVVPMSAHAAGTKKPSTTPPPLTVLYDAVGTTHIAKPNSDIALGPTTLTTAVRSTDGHLTGHLPIPQTSAAFDVAGFLPATAKVDFVEAAPVRGRIKRTGNRTFVTSQAKYYVKLSDVKIGGLPAAVGDSCQTSAPVTVPARTPKGQMFDLTNGGHLTGTYTIGDFANCGLTTAIINQLVPGAGNTVDFTVSNGHVSL